MNAPLPSEQRFSFAPWPSVVSVKQSPLNRLQWCLTLSCGHDLWVTAKGKPRRKRTRCERCENAEKTRFAPFDPSHVKAAFHE